MGIAIGTEAAAFSQLTAADYNYSPEKADCLKGLICSRIIQNIVFYLHK